MFSFYTTFMIVGFLLMLLLNIFFLYIPLSIIEKDLNDIDNRVQTVINTVEPFIQKIEPTLESLF